MAFNIQEIRSQLLFDGARPSHFQVTIQNPVNNTGDLKTPFMCRASNIPPSTINFINVSYFGRKIKVAGDRTFDEAWTVTIMNDEDFLIRNAMEDWMSSINSHEENLREFASASPLLYKSQAQVTQFSKTGIPIREYTFYGIFPTSLGNIQLDWETNDQIEVFDVEFAYDYWEVTGGVTGNSTA